VAALESSPADQDEQWEASPEGRSVEDEARRHQTTCFRLRGEAVLGPELNASSKSFQPLAHRTNPSLNGFQNAVG